MLKENETISSIMSSVARVCLKVGIRFQEIVPHLKKSFIVEGRKLLHSQKVAPTISKLSVMTGLQRSDVSKHLNDKSIPPKSSAISQVVSMWLNSPRFINQRGIPRVLSTEGRDSEFARLVAATSKELNSYAVLFEMLRAGLVEHTDDGIRLISSAHIVSNDKNEGVKILANDIKDLTGAVIENLESDSPPHLHLRLAYDNIASSAILEIQSKIVALAQQFMLNAQQIVSKYDKDISSEDHTTDNKNMYKRARYSLTIFNFSDEVEIIEEK